MKQYLTVSALTLALLFPLVGIAAGLVPCGNKGETSCEFCHAVTMLEGVAQWLTAVLTIFMSILIVISGLRMVVSAGDAQAKQSAKKMIINGAIGFMIVLAAWLIIDLLLQSLVGSDFAPAWDDISCVAQPVSQVAPK